MKLFNQPFRRSRVLNSLFLLGLLVALTACGGQFGRGADVNELEATSLSALSLVKRSGSQALAGKTVAGKVRIRLQKKPAYREVRFYVDDALRSGSPYQVVRKAPFDVVIDTTALSTGKHMLTAVALKKNRNKVSSEVFEATFKVDNAGVGEPPVEGSPDVAIQKAYYVDCVKGKDANTGTTTTTAWKSLARANKASLQPGEALLLKRGCSWVGPLNVRWEGTALQPIRVSAYGEGAKPVIRDSAWSNVHVTGSHLLIEQLNVNMNLKNLPRDAGCRDQPYGWKVGFNLEAGSSYVTVSNSQASGHMAGVRIAEGSSYNKVLRNMITDNVVMKTLTKANPDDDSGAWGMEVNGDDNEIAYNRFSNNAAWCSYDYLEDGSAVEVYGAERTYVHHNQSAEDLAFSELGGAVGNRAADTLLAYNLFASSKENAKFVIARGAESHWGPTSRTELYNNTVYLTGSRSEGVICHSGCGSNILTARNNIFWTGWKAAYADGQFAESHNIYWRSGGNPLIDFVGFQIDATSRVLDPQLVDPSAGNLRQAVTSPTVNAGTQVLTADLSDLDGTSVPQMSVVDLGAYESTSFAANNGF